VGDARLDYAFLFTLEVVTVTGLLLLVLRSTGAMSWLLIAHLASVVALYLVIPFSKFVHASHRFAALLFDAEEHARERELARRGAPHA
jgi:citrate/tricarballylate utilization protein